jgi:hypothetical protein
MAILEDIGESVRTMMAVKELSERTGQRSGGIRCPKCHGLIQWQLIGRKGATRGACETPNCVAWIE